MKFAAGVAVIFICVATMPVLAAADDIHLACDGTATLRGERSTSLSGVDDLTGGTITLGGTTTYAVNEADEILVDIAGDHGRIKPPRRLVPVIHSRSDDGWWDLSSLKISDTEIEGRFHANFFNRGSLTINRMTGHIDIVALGGSYSGICQPYDATPALRRF